MRFEGELDDLKKVSIIAEKWGYGNCIQWLQYAWADKLLKDGLSKKSAALGAGMDIGNIALYVKCGNWLKEKKG